MENSEDTSQKIEVSISLWVDCPHCEKDIDLMNEDYKYDNYFCELIFNNEWDEIDHGVDCPACGKSFQVEGAEH